MLRILTPSIGVIALLTTGGSFALNIIFAVELSQNHHAQKVPTIVASALLLIDLVVLPLSIVEYVRNDSQSEKTGRQRRAYYMFLAALALTGFLGASATLGSLAWMQICLNDLPAKTLGTSTSNLLAVALALGGAFAIFQLTYLVLLWTQARRSNAFLAGVEYSPSMQETQRPVPALGRYSHSTTSESPPLSPTGTGTLRRSNSAFSSIRSSLSQSLRPMTSKTRLLSRRPSNRSTVSSLKSSRQAPLAIDTNLSTIPSYTACAEDGFDSWDTSAVSQDSRQTISDSAPQSPFSSHTPSRPSSVVPFSLTLPPPTLPHSHSRTFLPTIPASPVVSRTPSPAFALDPPFKPITHRPRNRSRSPANSFHSTNSNRRRNSFAAPPSITDPAEAHIHPLFRSDSPVPAPAVSTPGTCVVAAPNAGRLITESDRASLRRMRSESLTSSPQVSSPLVRLDSPDCERETSRLQFQQQQLLDGANKKLMRQVERSRGRRASSLRSVERDSSASDETIGAESEKGSFDSQDQKSTTPIPEWILGAAPRNSFHDYQKRLKGSTPVEESDKQLKDGMV